MSQQCDVAEKKANVVVTCINRTKKLMQVLRLPELRLPELWFWFTLHWSDLTWSTMSNPGCYALGKM